MYSRQLQLLHLLVATGLVATPPPLTICHTDGKTKGLIDPITGTNISCWDREGKSYCPIFYFGEEAQRCNDECCSGAENPGSNAKGPGSGLVSEDWRAVGLVLIGILIGILASVILIGIWRKFCKSTDTQPQANYSDLSGGLETSV